MNKRFLLIANESKPASVEFSEGLKKHILSRGSFADIYTAQISDLSVYDYAIVLGGDGTVIDSAALLYEYEIPIAGINFGKLGYLSSCEPDVAFSLIDRILSKDFKLEQRTTIEGDIIRDNKKISVFMAVNDVSIHRGVVNSSLNFELSINGEVIDSFWSDGMLVSTPTGSTAYNLSAGGPVIAPDSNSFVVTQICAHSLNDCPIVMSDDDTVSITVLNDTSKPVFVADHQPPFEVLTNDMIFVRKGKKNIKTIKINNSSFYSILRKKISHR